MTSVPATINSFVNDLEKYIGFKNIIVVVKNMHQIKDQHSLYRTFS
jgi:hypothetical protein